LVRSTSAGTTLVFGYLGGGSLPFEESYPGAAFVFAFQSLPLVIFIGALSAVLYHYRVLPLIVRGFAFVLSKTLNISGAASFSTAANVFIGMVEAPLLVRPYLQNMSRSDLFIVMTGGMATIAGTVFVLFSVILDGIIPDPAGHLLTASIISAPAAVVLALILIPRGDDAVDETRVEFAKIYDNGIDALTRGTIDGLRLFAYIVGMLIVFVALVELANIILGAFPDVDGADLTLQRIFGWVLAPVVWVLGIPWSDAVDAGQLLGTKVVLNELVAYIDMSNLPGGALSEKSALIMTYAICGFANFGSAGIMIGGLAAIVPERRGDLAQLGLKSIVAGTMATCMTGAIAGLLFW
ncbi:MAG: nucleoside:proton symporter, partial [Chloroflexi bacterium]|nr:nucleoside:proton symporter [Chloroflexota bacterium]